MVKQDRVVYILTNTTCIRWELFNKQKTWAVEEIDDDRA